MSALKGKRALITGAATGMGRATAERFAQEGAELILFGLGGDLLDDVAAKTNGIAIHGDVTQMADIEAAISACDGQLDILVSAAGVIFDDDPETIQDEVWDKTFDVNTKGAMRMCRAAIPLLKKQGGAIVNIASVAAQNSGPGMASYAASKSALITYTKSIANAHGPDGIRANVVLPGWVRTPMSEMEMAQLAKARGTSPEEEFEKIRQTICVRRIAGAEEIAACCLFLASDEASFVSGTHLVADGGGRKK
jgi:NAD(P)-dependent dehydrogenase (short-subunit alcohol dehydrogenase family)